VLRSIARPARLAQAAAYLPTYWDISPPVGKGKLLQNSLIRRIFRGFPGFPPLGTHHA
jgi:hypothetical protein